jgi:group I intron endonuclease
MNGFIYLVTNVISGKRYVGKTTLRVDQRWKYHLYAAKTGSLCHLHKAIRKYGPPSFMVETLAQFVDEISLDFAERKFIKELGTKVPAGYNLTDGGEGTSGLRRPCSEETKKKISQSSRGVSRGLGQCKSEATRKKMRGNRNACKSRKKEGSDEQPVSFEE